MRSDPSRLRWLLLAVVLISLVLSLQRSVGLIGLTAKLARTPLPRRGQLALETSGWPGVGRAWAWVVGEESRLPAEARIYLAEPDFVVFALGSFFWYPRPLAAPSMDALVRGREDVVAPSASAGQEQLLDQGFTHVVQASPGSLEIRVLAPPSRSPSERTSPLP